VKHQMELGNFKVIIIKKSKAWFLNGHHMATLYSFVKLSALTPKIHCVFWPNSTIFDIVGEIIFSKNQSMRS
jgi:hypothetical protein